MAPGCSGRLKPWFREGSARFREVPGRFRGWCAFRSRPICQYLWCIFLAAMTALHPAALPHCFEILHALLARLCDSFACGLFRTRAFAALPVRPRALHCFAILRATLARLCNTFAFRVSCARCARCARMRCVRMRAFGALPARMRALHCLVILHAPLGRLCNSFAFGVCCVHARVRRGPCAHACAQRAHARGARARNAKSKPVNYRVWQAQHAILQGNGVPCAPARAPLPCNTARACAR